MRSRERRFVGVISSIVLLSTLGHSAPASANCPEVDLVDLEACEPHATVLSPGLFGVAQFPLRGERGPYLGGGIELVLLTWSNNIDSFGPSQGKIRIDVAGLAASADLERQMLLYRGGLAFSFERNASRRFLIPYLSADIGGLYETDLHARAFADAGLGLYLIYTGSVVVDAEASYLLPFTAFDDLAGPKAQLTASFALF